MSFHMNNVINNKHDTASYESCSYKREIFDIEVLYESFHKAKVGSDWKPQVQNFEINLLTELSTLQKELLNKSFKLSKPSEFVLSERGKTRVVSGDHIRDRVVKRALCDEILIPSINKYLIHDNGASLSGKGISFTRSRTETHLKRYYSEHGNNGWILLGDFTKYFDNIQHKLLMDMFKKIIDNETAIWLLEEVLKQARIDVSYMSDLEFENCLNITFNSIDYNSIGKEFLTGEKYMLKHMNIGDQIAQVAGIFYPKEFDNYIKIVEGVKYYNRYMDDFYCVHNEKEYLISLMKKIEGICKNNGIILNKNKTRICKVSDKWRYLQIQYSLTKSGKIIKKIHPKRLSNMRQKLKKMTKILDEKEFKNYFDAWFCNNYKIMSKQQRENMNMLYERLVEIYYV